MFRNRTKTEEVSDPVFSWLLEIFEVIPKKDKNIFEW